MGKRKRFFISNDEYKKILECMQIKHPNLFSKDQVKLFKIGVLDDLLTDGHFVLNDIKVSKTKTRAFLRKYVSMAEYQKAHVSGSERFDLNGKVCGTVTDLQESSVKSYLTEKAKIKQLAEIKRKEKKEKEREFSEKKSSWGILGIKG